MMVASKRAPQDHKQKDPPSSTGTITVDGRSFALPNQDDLSLDETILIEDATGKDIDDLKGTRVVAAMLWIAMRRQVPSITYAEITAMTWGDMVTENAPVPTLAVVNSTESDPTA